MKKTKDHDLGAVDHARGHAVAARAAEVCRCGRCRGPRRARSTSGTPSRLRANSTCSCGRMNSRIRCIPNFEKATGIKVNQTPFSQNEEQINKLQATGGEGFDLCQPTRDRAPQFKDLGPSRALRHEPRQERRQPHPLDARRFDQRLDLGWRPLPPAALLGFGSHFLAHRPVEGRSGHAQLRFAVGRRREGPYAGPRHSLPARHRPVDGCQRQAAVQPHARRLQGRRELQADL